MHEARGPARRAHPDTPPAYLTLRVRVGERKCDSQAAVNALCLLEVEQNASWFLFVDDLRRLILLYMASRQDEWPYTSSDPNLVLVQCSFFL